MNKILYEEPELLEIKGKMVLLDEKAVPFKTINFEEFKAVLSEDIEMREDLPIEFQFKVKEKGNKSYNLILVGHKKFGRELAKSFGSKSLEKKKRYIQVLSGKAKIILQGEDETGAYNVLRGNMKEGDITICPGNMGYTMINMGNEDLLFAEVREGENDIREYKNKRGAALYVKDYGYEVNTNYVVKVLEDFEPLRMLKYYEVEAKDLFKYFDEIEL